MEIWIKAAREVHQIRGWLRTRVFKCIDNLKTGLSVVRGELTQDVPKYLVIHGEVAVIRYKLKKN